MKTATFTIKRNDAIDMIRHLKDLVKRCDDPNQTSDYVALHLLKSENLTVDVKIKRIDLCNLPKNK